MTPLKLEAWAEALQDHPDRAFALYIQRGIANGFRIGFEAGAAPLRPRGANMLSASEHAEVVERYLLDEVRANRVIKVHSVDEAKLIGVHCSPVGVIPKKYRPDKWRLIADLSTPEGHSVNDGISKELASLSYISVDAVISGIVSLGRGALMAKMDIQQAYRNIPVHPGDRPLLGMHWKGSVFMDAALPFGLRSAPLIFSAVADAAQHVMEQMGAVGRPLCG